MRKTVLIPIANGSEEIEIIGIADVLRRAGAEVTLAAVEDQLQIVASRGIKIVADKLLASCTENTYDLIALPGGMQGAENLRDCAALIAMLKQQQQANRLYAAICASPVVVLQHHKLLINKKATAHPSLMPKLKNKENVRVLVDQNCITSQGPGTTLEFALKLVEILFDKERARQIAKAMVC